VFTLIDVGLLASQPTDKLQDFERSVRVLTRCSGPAIRGPAWSADRSDRVKGGAAWTTWEGVARLQKVPARSPHSVADYGRDGAPITYKAWVCSNPECGFNIRIDNGEISFGRAIGQSFK